MLRINLLQKIAIKKVAGKKKKQILFIILMQKVFRSLACKTNSYKLYGCYRTRTEDHFPGSTHPAEGTNYYSRQPSLHIL